MEQARIELLQAMPIFGGIREDILQLLLALSPVVCVARGDYFFREGDPASSLFVLESGTVAVMKNGQGLDFLLHTLGKGDCFGEMSLLDLFPRSASVRAREDCVALEISTASLHKVLEEDVEQFAIIEMNMGREVSRRLRESDAALGALQGSGSPPR